MSPEQRKLLDQITDAQESLTNLMLEYWKLYSHMGTWQFWVNVAMLVVPLIVIYFFIDRRRAFHIGFFGLNVHIWFTYIDATGIRFGLWDYPYQAIPIMSVSFSLDVSLIPVIFMLLYQWTLNNGKNYYLWSTGLSIFLSFILKPILVYFDLFELNKWVNFFHLFIGYTIIVLFSKWLTNLFIYFEKKGSALHKEKV